MFSRAQTRTPKGWLARLGVKQPLARLFADSTRPGLEQEQEQASTTYLHALANLGLARHFFGHGHLPAKFENKKKL